MSLDPRHLDAFLAVVEGGSLGRAARALGVTQPALSRIIRRLESAAGAELFSREAKGMDLTTFGEALLPHARLIREQSREAMEEIQALRGLGKGELRIGAVASAAISLAPPAIEVMLRRWPSLKIEVMEAVEDRLADALLAREVDLLIAGEIEQEGIVRMSAPGLHDRYQVVAAPDHWLAGQGSIPLRRLAAERWVMPPLDAPPRRQFHDLAASLGEPPPRVVIESRSTATVKALVAQGGLLAWLPEPLTLPDRRAGMLVELDVPELVVVRKFHVYRRRGFVPPAVTRFVEALGKACAP
ncbi:LysR family transcriptional regulator [Sphingosinicella sp. CPCC 101087]|uniref:LysR family transcriptional regulator n=1 Tax=Sphingosinicella sp. CPCC 101087 TaxID=2497754 RepID=UPI00101BCCFE|nr:LysR family transcriptional regulator [Sphingosinicella sp. CPCC 101087]